MRNCRKQNGQAARSLPISVGALRDPYEDRTLGRFGKIDNYLGV
jgi:hypothetical protein